MRTALIAGLLLAAAALPAAAQSQQRAPSGPAGAVLGPMDTNRDGVVSRDEYEGVQQQRFDRLDRNRDGVVSRDEFMAVERALFDLHDLNRDGKVTADELMARQGGPGQQRQPPGQAPAPAPRR